VFEDGIAHRVFALTGEASYSSFQDRKHQGEIRDNPMQCEVAEESVVVLKFRPVKSGNRVEGKTGVSYQEQWKEQLE
jgi:hypothetical protein